MNDALNVLMLGVLVGFGLSLVLGFLGASTGKLLAIFDV